MVPPTCLAKISGGQQKEGHGLVHHVQGEHHQSSLFDDCKQVNLKSVIKFG